MGLRVSVLAGIRLVDLALIDAALGHCAPGADCIDRWKIIVAAMVIAVTIGLAVRAAINALVNRRRDAR
ncbi:hypothetical protein ACVWZA_003318 [Sphingomonas sp. UYAg733]